MKHLKTNNLTRFPFQRNNNSGILQIAGLTNKEIIMKLSSLDIIFAAEVQEFFHEDTNEAVDEGEPIGFDIETQDGVDLILFSNIYWNPQY
jgi:hypothetical protein